MSGQFNVGDIAILRNDPAITTCPAIKRADGDEVVIIGSLRSWDLTDGPFVGYLVWHPHARDFYCAPHELRRPKPPTTGEEAIRAMFDVPALDVVLINPDFAVVAGENAFAHDGLDSISVDLEHGPQLFQIGCPRAEHVLDGFVFDEATSLVAINPYGESDAPVLTVDIRNGRKFNIHRVAFLAKKAIVTC